MKQMLLVLLTMMLLVSCSKSPSKYRVKVLSTNIINIAFLDEGIKAGDTILVSDYAHRDNLHGPMLTRALVLDKLK